MRSVHDVKSETCFGDFGEIAGSQRERHVLEFGDGLAALDDAQAPVGLLRPGVFVLLVGRFP